MINLEIRPNLVQELANILGLKALKSLAQMLLTPPPTYSNILILILSFNR